MSTAKPVANVTDLAVLPVPFIIASAASCAAIATLSPISDGVDARRLN